MSGSSQDYINYRIEKSSEAYEDAVLLAQNRRWNSAVNRLYYSSYYLVSALLSLNRIKSETHNGTKTQFFLNFIKSGPIEKSKGKLYSHLFDWRQETDYADFIDFDESTVLPLLEDVKVFNAEILELIRNS
jgi:uncharacterized protein